VKLSDFVLLWPVATPLNLLFFFCHQSTKTQNPVRDSSRNNHEVRKVSYYNKTSYLNFFLHLYSDFYLAFVVALQHIK